MRIVPVLLIASAFATVISSVPIDESAAASKGPLAATAKLSLKKQIFGVVGTTSPPKNVKLANKGDVPIALVDLAVQGDFAIDGGTSTCGASLAPREKCVIAITFTPTALGERLGTLTITHDAAGSPQAVALKGKSVVGKLVFTPKSLKFPNRTVGDSGPPRTIVVHNPNLVPLPITGIVLNSDAFAIASRTCGSVLAPGADCTIDVRFVPDVAGARKATLWFAARAAKSPAALKLKGKGLVERCGETTEDTATDPNNCGGCGNVCSGTCTQGQCQGATIACGPTTPDVCFCGSTTTCTDFLSDAANCGGCGNVCYVGQTCENGSCHGCTAVGAQDECGTRCTNFQGDPYHCGGCGKECASGICVAGECLPCTAEAPHECGGECTNLKTDAANCGGCGNVCPAGGSCQDGQCAGIVCSAGTPDQCGNRCTNLATDAANCGDCGTPCANGSCIQGTCVTCGGATPDQCGATCTDVTTDIANCGDCGNACPAGTICSGGGCIALGCVGTASQQLTVTTGDAQTTGTAPPIDCPATAELATAKADARATRAAPPIDCGSQTNCSGECADLKTAQFHCGDCSKSCVNACVNGQCLVCEGDTPDVCGRSCTNFKASTKNCGGCGPEFACRTGELCLGGVCDKPAICDGTPTNTNISQQHCGACNNPCNPEKRICRAGECVRLCEDSDEIICNGSCIYPFEDKHCGSCDRDCTKEGLSCVTPTADIDNPICSSCKEPTPDECGGKCVNLFHDRSNCGTCGKVCDDNAQCFGTCKPCEGEFPTRCGNVCVDTQRDPRNCGACGTNCGGDRYCFLGKCVDCPASAPDQCGTYGSICTNLKQDSSNCGKCGYPCGSREKCIDGECKRCDTPNNPCLNCTGATPNACGNTCVSFLTEANNCGGCGNVCPSGQCNEGQCSPGKCGAFEMTTFGGSVNESDTDVCGGTATLSLDPALRHRFTLVPSAGGGCSVSGALFANQSGAICGQWAGAWGCSGSVDGSGEMIVDCTCNTLMFLDGAYGTDAYSGSWTFVASGDDSNGDPVTDTAGGSFVIQRLQ